MPNRLVEYALAWARYRWRLLAGVTILFVALVGPLWGMIAVLGGFWWFVLALLYAGIGWFVWEGIQYVDARWPKFSPLHTHGLRPVWAAPVPHPEVQRWQKWVRSGHLLNAFHAAGLVTVEMFDEASGASCVVDCPLTGAVSLNRAGVLIEVRAGGTPVSSLANVEKRVSVIASHANLDGLLFEPHGAGQTHARLVIPWDTVPPLQPLAEIPHIDRGDYAVPVGVDDDGLPVRLSPQGVAGIMLSGVPGSGKTAVARLLLAAWQQAGADVRIADAKDGGDFSPFGDVVGDDIEDALGLFRGVATDMRSRLGAGKAEGVSNWWHRSPTTRGPLLVLAVDEAHEYLVKGSTKERREQAAEAEELLTTIAKRGRAAGVVLLLSTQKPDSTALPTALRDQLPVKISGQQLTREASRAALGELAEGSPVPHEIPAHSAGRAIGVGMVDRPKPVLLQAFYAPDDVIRAAASGGSAGARSAQA